MYIVIRFNNVPFELFKKRNHVLIFPKEFRFILVSVITVNYSVTILTKQFYDSSKIKCNGECIVELMDIMIEQFKDLLVNKKKYILHFR